MRHGSVRSIDVANYSGYSRPSVSRAMGILKNNGFITVDPSGYIDLNDSGRAIAEKIYERHNVLSKLLEDIGVSHETAINDTCKIEHFISDKTFSRIKEHVKSFGNKI